jgi:hypothetical protein
MIFGGKGKGRAEDVRAGELQALLNASFDRKLGPFRPRAEGIGRELRAAGQRFIDACDKFAKIDPEPYTEDLYSVNLNYIRSQKAHYAEALRRLGEDLVREPAKAPNAYEEFLAVARHTEEVTAEMLRTNMTFKLAVHCYPNYMKDFKKSFSSVERLSAALRDELEKRSGEYEEYKVTRDNIAKLEGYGERLAEVRSEAREVEEEMAHGGASPSEKRHQELQADLAAKRAELGRVEREAAGLRNRIGALTAPLDRASKKFDHLHQSRRPLNAFIGDPIGRITSDLHYAEFRAQLERLIEAVRSGAIEVKNREEAADAAAALLSTDLKLMLSSYKSLEHDTSILEGEVRAAERAVGSLKESRSASESAAHRLEVLRARVADLEVEREAEKRVVEGLFADNYKRPISIIL